LLELAQGLPSSQKAFPQPSFQLSLGRNAGAFFVRRSGGALLENARPISLISRAVAALEINAFEDRRAIYNRARVVSWKA
jgi:hypothetical protein